MAWTALGLVLSALALNGQAAWAQPAMPSAVSLPAGYAPHYQCLRHLHVDPARGRPWSAYADGGGGEAEPWRSPQDADDSRTGGQPVLRAGDCVDLAPGAYPMAATFTVRHGGDGNRPTGFVVYRSTIPGAAHLLATARFWRMIEVRTAYVAFDGLELDGAKATAEGEGVATGGDGRHHILVEHCRIHDMGGGGVQLNDGEYFWVIGNDIFANASTNTYQESGISIYQPLKVTDFAPTPADVAAPFHIVIGGNISHDNVETYPCPTPGCHTDGNGVIIDKTLNVDRPGGVAYDGAILVAGNLVYGNGGGGVHVYLSQHVTAANNTAYGDHVDLQNPGTWRGELSNVDSTDTVWLNNIGWARPGDGVLRYNSAILIAADSPRYAAGPTTWRANLTRGGVSVSGSQARVDPARNRLEVDPQLTDPAAHDFRPRPASPAIGAGEAQPWLASSAPDIGAF